jgi:D-serine deaminase-like pyridoxal phosphate-dependent protein
MDASALDTARRLIGQPVDAVPTPALTVEIDVVRRNVGEMARRMRALPAALRPHAKIHKSPAFGRMQVEAGAIGLTTATVWEASAMVADGLDRILVCNQVVGPIKAAELARIAGRADVTVNVESAHSVDELGAAARSAGSEIGALVELDVGLRRCGVRTVEGAAELAERVERTDGLRLRGAFGYEGHCMLEPDRELRVEKAKAAIAELLELVDELDRRGLSTEIVGAGGLGTWDITGANERITEIHAGSYIFMDAFHNRLVEGFDPALTVLSTVISRDGDVAVLDCGRKSLGLDRALPELVSVPGEIRVEHGEHSLHEEHTSVLLHDGGDAQVGATVRVMPGYAPTTVNLFGCYLVVSDDRIVDVLPVCGRYGPDTAGVGG